MLSSQQSNIYNDGDLPPRKKQKNACVPCHDAKVRCEWSSLAQSKCDRCLKFDKECVQHVSKQGQRPKKGAPRKVKARKKRSPQVATNTAGVAQIATSEVFQLPPQANSAGTGMSALPQGQIPLLALQSLALGNAAPVSGQLQTASQTSPSNIDPRGNFNTLGSLLGNNTNQSNLAILQSVLSQAGLLNQAAPTNLQPASQLSLLLPLLNMNTTSVLPSMSVPHFPQNNFTALLFPQSQSNVSSMQPSQNQFDLLLEQIRQQNGEQESQQIIQLLIQLVEQELRNRTRK
jgi:hypothetical protein